MNRISTTYRITAFLLAFLVFLSTGGLILTEHHCKMKEKSLAEGKQYSCVESGCKKGCCSTEFYFFKLNQDFQKTQIDINVENFQKLGIQQVPSLLILEGIFPTHISNFLVLKLLLLRHNFQILFQSFLL